MYLPIVIGVLAIRDLLAAPLADARQLLVGRMPVPRLLQTDQGGSQVRGKSPERGSRKCMAEKCVNDQTTQ